MVIKMPIAVCDGAIYPRSRSTGGDKGLVGAYIHRAGVHIAAARAPTVMIMTRIGQNWSGSVRYRVLRGVYGQHLGLPGAYKALRCPYRPLKRSPRTLERAL